MTMINTSLWSSRILPYHQNSIKILIALHAEDSRYIDEITLSNDYGTFFLFLYHTTFQRENSTRRLINI